MHYPNPRHLRAFVAVATLRSFHAAAQTLHIGQPALSQAIAKLEDLVGVRLLERTTRSVRLTAAGEEFLENANRVLEGNERLVQNGSAWAQADRGRLSILCIPSVAHRLLPSIVRAFGEQHPDVDVEVHDLTDPVIRDRMGRREGDLAILSQQTEDEAGATLPLLRDRFQVVLPAGHPLARHKQVDLSALPLERVIVTRRGTVFRAYADRLLEEAGAPRTLIEVHQTNTLVGMVEAGLGFALLPAMSCPSPALASVITRPLANRALGRVLSLARHKDRSLMPAASAFARMAVDHITGQGERLPSGVTPASVTPAALRRFLAD